MDIIKTIPKIIGNKYLGINLSICIGADDGHWIVEFRNEGGGYYPVILMDDKNEFSFDRSEYKKMAKWIDATCTELDKIEGKYVSSIKN